MSDKKVSSQITLSMTDEGDFFIDMNIEDYSDESIENFAKLVSSLGTLQIQLEALEMATSGILESMPEKVEPFVTKIAEMTTKNLEYSLGDDSPTSEEGQEDKPCIKPSDLF